MHGRQINFILSNWARRAVIRDGKLLRDAYREVQSKLMQFQPRVRWKIEKRFCNDRLNSSFPAPLDKKKKRKRSAFLKESNYCSLISSCSVENKRINKKNWDLDGKESYLRCFSLLQLLRLRLQQFHIYEGKGKQMKICNLFIIHKFAHLFLEKLSGGLHFGYG